MILTASMGMPLTARKDKVLTLYVGMTLIARIIRLLTAGVWMALTAEAQVGFPAAAVTVLTANLCRVVTAG